MARAKDVSPAKLNPPAEAGYTEELDYIIEQLPQRTSFPKYVEACEGAFPSIVLERLEQLGRRPRYGPEVKNESRFPYGPELHPLDFEWYFTEATASIIASSVRAQSGRILCLGTPTVAMALSEVGRNSTLVDRNPLVILRLAGNRGTTIIESKLVNLEDFAGFRPSYDAVIFDAPWYSDSLRLWLWHATRAVKPGGRVVFVLFKKLLRPSAATEREQVLDLVHQIGQMERIPDAVRYETPLFERVALQGKGIRGLPSWRTADLVSIVVKQAMQNRPTARKDPDWDTFLIQHQVIKVRRIDDHECTPSAFLIQPVDGYETFVYDSVSQRDPMRDQVSLWTSRNRIARVGKRRRLVRLLSELQQMRDPEKILRSRGALDLRDHERLALRKVLDFV